MGFTDVLTFITKISYKLVFVSISDATLGNIIGRHFDFDSVTFENLDVVHTNFARNSARHDMTVAELNLEGCVA